MKFIQTFESFLNESKKMNDYEKSRDKILVGLKSNLLRDMLDRYDHEEAGDSIHFFDKKGNHFATLFDRGTRYQELRHNGTINDKGWLTESEDVLNEDNSMALLLILQAAALNGLLFGSMAASSAGDGIHPINDLKAWWAKRKKDKAVQSIVDKLKDDPEVIAFMNQSSSAQRGKWFKLIEPKLNDDEKQYLKNIYRTNFK